MTNEFFPGHEPTDEELNIRLGYASDAYVQNEGVRVKAIWQRMRDERGQYGAIHDSQLLDGWHGDCRRRLFNKSPAGQLRELLRFERQLLDLASGEYWRRREAAQGAANAADQERQAREFPAALLAQLRAAGKPLALDKEGHITALPGAGLHLNEIAAVKQHKEALVALLHAEAEAARPVVIA